MDKFILVGNSDIINCNHIRRYSFNSKDKNKLQLTVYYTADTSDNINIRQGIPKDLWIKHLIRFLTGGDSSKIYDVGCAADELLKTVNMMEGPPKETKPIIADTQNIAETYVPDVPIVH